MRACVRHNRLRRVALAAATRGARDNGHHQLESAEEAAVAGAHGSSSMRQQSTRDRMIQFVRFFLDEEDGSDGTYWTLKV